MQRGKKWKAVFDALADFAHSQEACEAMTNAVLHALASVKPETGVLRGSAHPSAKLTEEQVSEIREKSQGLTTEGGWRQLRAVLAVEYDVSIYTIERVAKGDGWRHV
jgi:hypothetical protein